LIKPLINETVTVVKDAKQMNKDADMLQPMRNEHGYPISWRVKVGWHAIPAANVE
jgi:hypothetical protein